MSTISDIPITGYASAIYPNYWLWNNAMAIQNLAKNLSAELDYCQLLKMASVITSRKNMEDPRENITY